MSRSYETVAALLLAAGMLVAFRQPLLAMEQQWDVSPMYSYGYVVPFISVYLIRTRKDEFAAKAVVPSRIWGLIAIAASLAALMIGRLNGIQVLEQLSFVSMIAGIVLFVFGRSYFVLAAPAIAYLLFMVPLWDAFTEPLHWPFQVNSARLGVSMMQAIGVPVYREGTVIALPNLVIEVARECSGVNYLVAVLALALPLAFLRLQDNWRRVVLVVSSLTVAGLANSLRVALIGTLAYYDVGSPLHGPFHVLHGLFVAGIGFVVIFFGLRLLETDSPRLAAAPGAGGHAIAAASGTRDMFGLAVFFWVLAFVGVAPSAREVALAHPLEALPLRLGSWVADSFESQTGIGSSSLPVAGAAWSAADRKLERTYRSPSGRAAQVEVYYFAVQGQGREIVSSASADLHRDAKRAEIGRDGQAFEVNVVEWPERNETGLFWYDSDGSARAGQVATKLSTIWRAMVSGRTNGAAIVVRTSTHPGAVEELQDLATALRPALNSVLVSDGGR